MTRALSSEDHRCNMWQLPDLQQDCSSCRTWCGRGSDRRNWLASHVSIAWQLAGVCNHAIRQCARRGAGVTGDMAWLWRFFVRHMMRLNCRVGGAAVAARGIGGPAKPAVCVPERSVRAIVTSLGHVCAAHVRAQVAHQCLQLPGLGCRHGPVSFYLSFCPAMSCISSCVDSNAPLATGSTAQWWQPTTFQVMPACLCLALKLSPVTCTSRRKLRSETMEGSAVHCLTYTT